MVLVVLRVRHLPFHYCHKEEIQQDSFQQDMVAQCIGSGIIAFGDIRDLRKRKLSQCSLSVKLFHQLQVNHAAERGLCRSSFSP